MNYFFDEQWHHHIEKCMCSAPRANVFRLNKLYFFNLRKRYPPQFFLLLIIVCSYQFKKDFIIDLNRKKIIIK